MKYHYALNMKLPTTNLWTEHNNYQQIISENVVNAYMKKLSKEIKLSTLWTT